LECVTLDIESCHQGVAHPDALRVGACIEFAMDRQASFGRDGTDQFDHRLTADQRLASPGLGYEAELTVRDFVPLRRAGG
jgi:hypothetical protein